MESQNYKLSPISGSNGEYIDVFVKLDNGQQYVGSFYTLGKVMQMKESGQQSGDFCKGKYFWTSNMIIVDEINDVVINETIKNLLENDGFYTAFFPANQKAVENLMRQVS